MTEAMAKVLQSDLLDIFHSFELELNVAVGLVCRGGEWGVAIISQDSNVDASNVGTVTARRPLG